MVRKVDDKCLNLTKPIRVASSREQQLEKANKRLEQEVKLLQQKVDLLLHRLYGKSSEKSAPDQEDFLFVNIDALGKSRAKPRTFRRALHRPLTVEQTPANAALSSTQS